jgi:hypothetical protein
MTVSPMRPRRVGEILDAGIKVYLGNARTLMGLAAAVVIPTQVVAAIVLLSTVSSGSDIPTGFSGFSTPARRPADSAAAVGAQLILILVGLIVTTLVTAASVKAVSDIYLGQPTGVKISLRFALRRLGAVIGLELLSGIGLTIGFIALVIPGIWLYGLWSVAVPVLLIERTGPASALGRSRRLVSGRWWPTAGVLLVATIMVSVISGAFQALLVGVSSLPSQPSVVAAVIVTTASGAISTIIVRPFEACVRTILYYDLRVRKEGYDLELLAEQLGLPSLAGAGASDGAPAGIPAGPESVGRPGGPPFWPPPPGWRATP